MGNSRSCSVSFTDTDGVTHSVEVTAESLYEAAALGLKAFKEFEWEIGPPLTLDVKVRAPEITHGISVRKFDAWLNSGGKSPKEAFLRSRLKEVLGDAEDWLKRPETGWRRRRSER